MWASNSFCPVSFPIILFYFPAFWTSLSGARPTGSGHWLHFSSFARLLLERMVTPCQHCRPFFTPGLEIVWTHSVHRGAAVTPCHCQVISLSLLSSPPSFVFLFFHWIIRHSVDFLLINYKQCSHIMINTLILEISSYVRHAISIQDTNFKITPSFISFQAAAYSSEKWSSCRSALNLHSSHWLYFSLDLWAWMVSVLASSLLQYSMMFIL